MFCKPWPQDKLWLESPRAALLAPSEGAAPTHTGWACVRKEGWGSSFLGHRVPGSANAADTSAWLCANRAMRPPAPHLCTGAFPVPSGLRNHLGKGMQGHWGDLCNQEVATRQWVLGEAKELPPVPGWSPTAIQDRQVVPGGAARRGKGGGCHEEAAEDAGCGETGAAPAFPKHRLLAGSAE